MPAETEPPPPPEDGDGSGDAVPEPERRYPSTIGGACYLVVLAVVLVGLGVAGLGSWRTGIRVVAGALLVASVLRLLLRQRDAGMLAVRHRLVDATLLAGTAAALVFLVATIPDQPGPG